MENLGIDGKLLIAQLVNFGVFFFIFKKYIAKPFMKFLQQEKQNEKEKEILLNKLKKGEEELELKEKAMVDKVRNERVQLLDKAKSEVQEVRAGLIEEAKKEAEALKEKAHKEIEAERVKLYQEAKNKAAALSMILIEKSLKDYLDSESKKRITQAILTNLSLANSKNEN